MLQVAIAQEFAGQEERSPQLLLADRHSFPQSAMAPKAMGAKRRLESVGKPLTPERDHARWPKPRLGGLQGQNRRRALLGHLVRTLQAGYGRPPLTDGNLWQTRVYRLGVNLDTDSDALRSYLAANRPSWHHCGNPKGSTGGWPTKWGSDAPHHAARGQNRQSGESKSSSGRNRAGTEKAPPVTSGPSVGMTTGIVKNSKPSSGLSPRANLRSAPATAASRPFFAASWPRHSREPKGNFA
jgi:hypothetical protein